MPVSACNAESSAYIVSGGDPQHHFFSPLACTVNGFPRAPPLGIGCPSLSSLFYASSYPHTVPSNTFCEFFPVGNHANQLLTPLTLSTSNWVTSVQSEKTLGLKPRGIQRTCRETRAPLWGSKFLTHYHPSARYPLSLAYMIFPWLGLLRLPLILFGAGA